MKKRLICAILAILIIMSTLVVTPLSVSAALPTEATDGVHLKKGDYYSFDKWLDTPVYTIEATIYIDKASSAHQRTLFSTVKDGNFPYFEVHLRASTTDEGEECYVPEVEFVTNNGGTLQDFSAMLTTTKLPLQLMCDTWYALALVVDPVSHAVSAYINGGEDVGEKSYKTLTDANAFPFTKEMFSNPTTIGMASSAGTYPKSFEGGIKDLALFSTVKTRAEIAEDYANGISPSDEGLLAYYEFDEYGKSVSDLTGNGHDLTFCKEWLTEDEMNVIRLQSGAITADNAAYAIAVIGDIQTVTQCDLDRNNDDDPDNDTNYVYQMHKWLADNAATLGIKYVIGVGDITEYNTPAEWDIVYPAISQLNGVVDYTLVRGDHDWKTVEGSDITNYFDLYFGADSDYMAQFDGENGGFYEEGSALNSYRIKRLGDEDWLFIHLDIGVNNAEDPEDIAVVEWAKGLIESYPTHKVAITTHEYLDYDGNTQEKKHFLWEELASKYENVEMVFSGDMASPYVIMRQTKGEEGNTVSQFLVNFQHIDNYYVRNIGDKSPVGVITIYYFSEDGKTVSTESYSPIKGAYFKTTNQYTFDRDADKDDAITEWKGTPVAPTGKGTEANPYIIEHPGNLIWLSQQVTTTTNGTAAFAGKYFKQVCDIDLEGHILKPIGSYYESASNMTAFGGYYDGGGYSIKNGIIAHTYASNHASSQAYADGLFGVIYGATVKNIVLEDIEIWSNAVTGGIVGRAAAPFDGTADEDFNVISGCTVKESVKIHSEKLHDANRNGNYDNSEDDGFIGSICGIAHATTIKNCSSSTTISLDGIHYYTSGGGDTLHYGRTTVGGIVGAAGYGSVIDGATFSGGIVITGATVEHKNKIWALGGIVGLISPNNTTGYVDTVTAPRGIQIKNCLNSGMISTTGAGNIQKSTTGAYIGGIVGYARILTPVDGVEKAYTIENCYNTAPLAPVNTNGRAVRVGGLVGYADTSDASDTLYVTNSASVLVTTTTESAITTNEYQMTSATNASGLTAVTADAKVMTLSAEEIDKYLVYIENGSPALENFGGSYYFDGNTGYVYKMGELGLVFAMSLKGDDGENGVTPQLKVGEDNYWYVSYDNGVTWTSLGVKASGADGADGAPGQDGQDGAPGQDGQDGAKGDKGDKGDTGAAGADGAPGADGADGKTPVFKVEDGNLYVRYSDTEEWTLLGKVQGADGADGAKGDKGDTGATGPQGESGQDGKDATATSGVVSSVMSAASLLGVIAVAVFFIISKKKLI